MLTKKSGVLIWRFNNQAMVWIPYYVCSRLVLNILFYNSFPYAQNQLASLQCLRKGTSQGSSYFSVGLKRYPNPEELCDGFWSMVELTYWWKHWVLGQVSDHWLAVWSWTCYWLNEGRLHPSFLHTRNEAAGRCYLTADLYFCCSGLYNRSGHFQLFLS